MVYFKICVQRAVQKYTLPLEPEKNFLNLQGRYRDTDVENGHVDPGGGKGEGGTKWEVRTDIYTPPCVK